MDNKHFSKTIVDGKGGGLIDSVVQSPYISPIPGQIPRIGGGSNVGEGKYYDFCKNGMPLNALESLKELNINVSSITFRAPEKFTWQRL